MAINLKNCRESCIECIKQYKEKHFEDFRSGRIEKSFRISCSGIPKEYVDLEVMSRFPSEDPEEIEILLDPVKWAEVYLDWFCLDEDGEVWKRKNPKEYWRFIDENSLEAVKGKSRYHRPYQANMLRCTSNRKIFRIGRQAGKCIVSGSKIHMADGSLKKIEDVCDGDEILTINSEYKISKTMAFTACNGRKKVLGLKLEDGKYVEATPNHPFLIRNILEESHGIFDDNWRELGDLQQGDLVAIPSEFGSKENPIIDNDVSFVKIANITPLGEKMTWDLTVPETSNFIVNEIISHNTESLVVSMLYHLFIRPGLADNDGWKIVLIAPYQSQIELVFKRIKQLIESSKFLKNEILVAKQSPQHIIVLKNGSQVIGFTAGTKSGSGAASARGQAANQLVFDEADYLNPEDMEAAMSIITNYPEASLWMSSTPTGKREKFYEHSKSSRWKEFHYPSYINPLWNKDLEETFREALSSLAWVHEIEADFGEMEEGVFQHMYIKIAQDDYAYGDLEPNSIWEYTIGVDWNDVINGTTIVCTGFNPVDGKYYVVDRKVVQREGHTQLRACQEIAMMNRFWRPAAIYLDKGHGGTQWELLRKMGFEALTDPDRGRNHPDANLRKVVAYDFGSNIEVRDPWTKEPIKKQAKGFLVENAVRFFENALMSYPTSDDELTKQLQGYVVDRVSDTGRRVFKSGKAGDHTLDALMLSLVAFAMERSIMGRPKFGAAIRFTPSIPLMMSESLPGEAIYSQGGTVTPTEIETRPPMNRTEGVTKKEKEQYIFDRSTSTIDEQKFKYDEVLPYRNNQLPENGKNGIIRRVSMRSRPRRRNI